MQARAPTEEAAAAPVAPRAKRRRTSRAAAQPVEPAVSGANAACEWPRLPCVLTVLQAGDRWALLEVKAYVEHQPLHGIVAGELSLALRRFLARAERERDPDSDEDEGRQQQAASAADAPVLSDADDDEAEQMGGQQGQRAALARVQQLCERLLRVKAAGKRPFAAASAAACTQPGLYHYILHVKGAHVQCMHDLVCMLSGVVGCAGGMHLVPLEQLQGLLRVLDSHVQRGQDKVISPDDEVGAWWC